MYKNKWIFVLLLSITALVISGSAAYFSVFGLSKLFAGAGISALILFGALEIGKIISVSVLYRYWKRFSFLLRTIFTTMVIGIMFITSMGIYGFLRNAYDQTSVQLTTIQKETTIQEQRKNNIQLEIDRYQKEVDSKNKQIDTYIDNRNVQENLVYSLYTQSADTNLNKNQSWVYRTRAKETQDDIKNSDKLINDIRSENNELYNKINSLNDSISRIDRTILDIQSTDIAIEIGPLKYLSELTGLEMDDVVGFLIFLIIFVFDPFAIILIMAANGLSIKTSEEIEYYNKRKKEVEEKKKLKESNKVINNNNLIHRNIKKIAQRYTDNRLQKQIDNLNKDIKEFDSIKNNIDKLNEKYNDININEQIDEISNLKENFENFKNELNENDIKLDNLKNILTNISNSSKNDEFEKEINSLNEKIEYLMNNKYNDNFKELKNTLDNEIKDYVNILNEKIEKLNKNEKLYNELENIKNVYDKRLSKIDEQIKERIEIIETIPGRNTRRPGARIAEQQIIKNI